MMFWRNAVLLIAIAAWVPIVVGLLGRVFYFRPDRNQSATGAERVAKAREDEFEIPNQEPQEGDEAFRPPLTGRRSRGFLDRVMLRLVKTC